MASDVSVYQGAIGPAAGNYNLNVALRAQPRRGFEQRIDAVLERQPPNGEHHEGPGFERQASSDRLLLGRIRRWAEALGVHAVAQHADRPWREPLNVLRRSIAHRKPPVGHPEHPTAERVIRGVLHDVPGPRITDVCIVLKDERRLAQTIGGGYRSRRREEKMTMPEHAVAGAYQLQGLPPNGGGKT